MHDGTPLSCWQCGTVLSTTGGRCPACGAEQPTEGSPTLRQPADLAAGLHASAPPLGRRERPAPAPPPSPVRQRLPLLLLAGGLLAIGGLALALRPSAQAPEAPPATLASVAPPPDVKTADPGDLGAPDPRAADPAELLGRARTRALAWNRDAVLVELRATPVRAGRVDLTGGGKIEYEFGVPTGEGFGPGSRVAGKRLKVVLGGSGSEVTELPGAARRAAHDPNCPLDEAVRKAEAAGLPPGGSVGVVYDVHPDTKKAVWRVTALVEGGPTRVLDGWSCAIQVR